MFSWSNNSSVEKPCDSDVIYSFSYYYEMWRFVTVARRFKRKWETIEKGSKRKEKARWDWGGNSPTWTSASLRLRDAPEAEARSPSVGLDSSLTDAAFVPRPGTGNGKCHCRSLTEKNEKKKSKTYFLMITGQISCHVFIFWTTTNPKMKWN